MISFRDMSITYAGAGAPTLRGVRADVDEGEFLLVVGATGSGKTTLLRSINGLVPHFTGGTMHGRVVVAGRDTRTHRPRDLADVVGFVAQNPVTSFVAETVEAELAYGMETMGVDGTAMRRRVEETLDLFGLADVRSRPLATLSGGQQQRVAIGAVFAAGPRIIVLDEPTSALDPVAAEEVLASLHRIVHDLGVTVVLAEHRLERVVHHADSVALVRAGQVEGPMSPAEAMARSDIYPPVVALGRAAGWHPLPLSVRQARRLAAPLRAALAQERPVDPEAPLDHSGTAAEAPAALAKASVMRGDVVALRQVTTAFERGTVTAVMGRNGSGKSTLLGALAGLFAPTRGSVRIAGASPHTLPAHERVKRVGLVPQDPGVLLYADSIATECATADKDFAVPAGTTARLFADLAGPVDPSRHPRDLSEGQRLCLALAVILAGAPPVLLLDEPTRGLDYAAKARLGEILRRHAALGRTIVVATHDVELAADICDRVLILADGDVVADGAADDILSGSPAFAPQVAKVVHPAPYLTVADVLATGALARVAG